MWTDEGLGRYQKACSELTLVHSVVFNAELYRLARLGLAAEQVGQEGFSFIREELPYPAVEPFTAFLNHEAWRK